MQMELLEIGGGWGKQRAESRNLFRSLLGAILSNSFLIELCGWHQLVVPLFNYFYRIGLHR